MKKYYKHPVNQSRLMTSWKEPTYASSVWLTVILVARAILFVKIFQRCCASKTLMQKYLKYLQSTRQKI